MVSRDGADLEGFSLIEAQPEGWFYGTQLASGQRLIAWHCDHDLAAAGQRRNLMARIHASTLMRRFAQGMAARRAPLRVAAWSARLPQLAGAGWAAVGDAACSFDPLSSQGLFSALYAGLRLANALHANDHALRSEAYATEMDDVWAAYLQHHRRYYASEPRWPEQAFWQRRLTSVRG